MDRDIVDLWRKAFWESVTASKNADPLKKAILKSNLGEWTRVLTRVSVSACKAMGWKVSAKGHKLDLLPEPRSEYLGLDAVAFPDGPKRWRFPVAVFELENSRKMDRISYCLWKLLCIHTDLRVLFCYRNNPKEAPSLVRHFRKEVVEAMDIHELTNLRGSTVVVVGSRAEAETFPYGFFKWWYLEDNTFEFRLF